MSNVYLPNSPSHEIPFLNLSTNFATEEGIFGERKTPHVTLGTAKNEQ